MNLEQGIVAPSASILSFPKALHATAIQARDRVVALDVVRGMVLFGVLMVNLTTEFRISIFQQFLGPAPYGSGIDRLLEHVVSAGLESKAFSLFSILFGVGMAIQFDRLAIRGRPFYWLLRRLLVLLAFGLVHLLLIWNGDILTEYAIVGLLVLPCLRLRPRYLAIAALAFLSIYIAQASLWSIDWPGSNMLKAHVALANTVYSTGSYADIVQFSFGELPIFLKLHLDVLPRNIALFLFGMFFWRVGVLTHPAQFRKSIRITAVTGVLGGAAILATDGAFLPASWALLKAWSMNLAPVMLAFGYGATILALTALPVARERLKIFVPLGRMTFTNYLMQSLICSCIFFGYGLGQFGHMAVAPACALAVVIYLVQVMLSTYWLRHYRFGPMEWLWRTLMYGQRQPMRFGRA